MEEVIAKRRVGLKRKGKELIGPCPRCNGDDRFSISIQKQVFNCRGCAAKGDVISLIEFLDGVDFNAACETLTGEPAPKPNGHDTGKPRHGAPWIYKDAEGKSYLKVDRFDKPDGKKSYPQYHWDGTQWIKGKPKGPKIPYRLPELLDSDPDTHGERICSR